MWTKKKDEDNINKQIQTDSLNFATVFGFLQVLVQFDDPFLILLLLDTSNLLQFAGPLVFQHLINTDKHWRALIWKCFLTLKRTREQDIQNVFDRFHEMFAVERQLCAQVKMFDTAAEHPTSSFTCCASKCWEATAFTSWSLNVFPSSCITLSISVFCLPDRENSLNWLAHKEIHHLTCNSKVSQKVSPHYFCCCWCCLGIYIFINLTHLANFE